MSENIEKTKDTPEETGKLVSKTVKMTETTKADFEAYCKELGVTHDQAVKHLTQLGQKQMELDGLGGAEKQVATDVELLTKEINDKVLHAFGQYKNLEADITRRHAETLTELSETNTNQKNQIKEHEKTIKNLTTKAEELANELENIKAENKRLQQQYDDCKPLTEAERLALYTDQIIKIMPQYQEWEKSIKKENTQQPPNLPTQEQIKERAKKELDNLTMPKPPILQQ